MITTKDYAELKMHRGALQAVVESLMLTSHLMFVGFSMEDEDFVDAVARVKAVRDLAEDRKESTVATVLALHPDAVSKHKGFKNVEMLDHPGRPKEAARRLEDIPRPPVMEGHHGGKGRELLPAPRLC